MDLQGLEKKRGKPRKLSRFMCQELLYDYVSGSLDESRQVAVESYIPTCRDTMHELEKLRSGVDYARTLAKISVPPQLIESLVNYEPAWQKTLRRITLWSEERGWKLIAPLFLIATFASAIVVWAPWKDSRLNELARIEHTEIAPQSEIAPQATAAVDAVTAPATVPLDVGPANEEKPAVQAGPNLGAVYRATFELKDVSAKAESLRLKILELEGEMRPKGDSVFDFTLPESKLDVLKTYLSTLGPVRLRKDKRPQEMPVGQNRVILLLKEIVPKEAAPIETSPQEAAPAEPPKEPAQDGNTSEGTSSETP